MLAYDVVEESHEMKPDPAGRAALNNMLLASRSRRPYVGEGADGARRSAQIDREEADVLAYDDPRRDLLEQSARSWDRWADYLDTVEATARPSERCQVDAANPEKQKGVNP